MMGAIRVAPASALPVSLAELKAYARISASDEEALLAAMMRSATDLCERFTGRLLIVLLAGGGGAITHNAAGRMR